MKEHSNFVASLINFKNGATRGTGTIEKREVIKEIIKPWSERISTRVEMDYQNTQVLKMIENENKLIERLELLEKRLADLSKDRDALKAEVDSFRLIGLANNPMLDEEGVGEIYLAEHRQSVASMSIETRLRHTRQYQKVLEIYIESIKLDSSKIQIKSDIADRRETETKKTSQEIANSREVEKKKRFSSFYKSVTGNMKAFACSEAQAINILISMKVPLPEGYIELCGESFKRELKSLLEKKGEK